MTEEKKYDGVSVMSQISGLERVEVKKIWEEVKENHRKLDSCGDHEFLPVSARETNRVLYRCEKCFGTIGTIEHVWYQRGRKDEARANNR